MSSPHQSARPLRLIASACGAAALAAWSLASGQANTTTQPDVPVAPEAVKQLPAPTPPPSNVPHGLWRWLNPSTAPFIPVPEIAVDPNSGTTLGLLPTWLHTDEQHEISRIIAPDILHNPFFGYGGHMRIYEYPSADEQWSLVVGAKQRVERELDAEFQTGRERLQRWSINTSVIYNRDGSPRFFGIGNESPAIAETNYTLQEELLQVQVGYNLTHAWQLQYTGRLLEADVLPGTLSGIASIQHRFADVLGLGTNSELLNRVSIVYDTRDDLTVPSRGMEWVVYGGMAGRHAFFDDSLYTEAGIDGRAFWPLYPNLVVASHIALRYLPSAHQVPFWALSSIGGGESVIGGEQPLRGYGEGRYYDRDSFSATLELRRRAFSFNAVSTLVDIEVAPFIDIGRVFPHTDVSPLSHLHTIGGVGFRGIARPFVVGYVDMGYGSEGLAVFTGINYPF
ncbi:MAG TPA: BamA/TamA family outer membrane protein [Steroidobacteraceae bacterium]|jgi:hypothetical protein